MYVCLCIYDIHNIYNMYTRARTHTHARTGKTYVYICMCVYVCGVYIHVCIKTLMNFNIRMAYQYVH